MNAKLDRALLTLFKGTAYVAIGAGISYLLAHVTDLGLPAAWAAVITVALKAAMTYLSTEKEA